MSKPKWLPPLEDAGHIALGFITRLTYTDAILWWREVIHQHPPADDKYPVMYVNLKLLHDEVDGALLTSAATKNFGVNSEEYYPACRVNDTFDDMKKYEIGKYLAELVRWPLLIYGVMKFYGN